MKTTAGVGYKLSIVAACLIVAVVGYWYLPDFLDLEFLATKETQLRAWRDQRGALTVAMAFLLYVFVAGVSVPGGATTLSVVYGWYFGFWMAMLLVSFASTAGATLAFLSSRYLFRDMIEARFGDKLAAINKPFERDGPLYLLSLRLFPGFPFFLVNLLMGLTSIRTTTYWWVSQLGMIPGTALFVFFGSQLPNLETLASDGVGGVLTFERIAALALLGVGPLLIRLVLRRVVPPTDT